MRRGIAALAVCAAAAATSVSSGISASADGPVRPVGTPFAPVRLGTIHHPTGSRASSLLHTYVVRTHDLAGQRRLASWAAVHGVVTTAQFGTAIAGAGLVLSDAQIAVVRSMPDVVSVELDAPVRLSGVEGGATWGLDRIDQRSSALDGSYRYAVTGAGVKAYVLDTGIRSTHADFVGRVTAGAYFDLGGTADASDCNGHGTHTAGSLGGTVYGVAKGVTIVPVKVLACDGSGSNQTVIAGLDWVLKDHRPGEPAVVNLSLGGPGSADVDAAVQTLIDAGITVVAAAGNSSSDACGVSPARAPSAITVGAVAQADTEAAFSNYGSCVDIFAPGVDIVSDWFTDDTTAAIASGTSMAAPHVAGAVALLLQAHPTFTPAQVWKWLDATATARKVVFQAFDVGSPSKVLYTGPIAVPTALPTPTTIPGNGAVTLKWVAPTSDGNMPVTGYRLQRSLAGGAWTTFATATPAARSLVVGGLHNGVSYRFRVAALNFVGAGPDSTSSVAVTPRTVPSVVARVSTQPLDRATLLTWTAPASDGGAVVRNYRIQRSTDGITWRTVTSTAPLSLAYTVTGLVNGVTYRFRVAAANIAGPGAWSASTSVRPRPVPSAPGRPSASAASTRVTLRWSAPLSRGGSAITGYRLLKSVNGVTWLVVTAHAPLTRTFTVSGLTNGIAYRFRVAAVNGDGVGAWSSVASATPRA